MKEAVQFQNNGRAAEQGQLHDRQLQMQPTFKYFKKSLEGTKFSQASTKQD